MSMYDLVTGNQGQHERGRVLLAILGINDPGRFRDAWVERGEDGEPVIAIYTRNGGGNREHWDGVTEAGPGCDCTGCIATHQLPAEPLYLRDQDDEFDSTYATFYFRAPDEYRDRLAEIAQDPVNMSDRWKAMIDAIGREKPATEQP